MYIVMGGSGGLGRAVMNRFRLGGKEVQDWSLPLIDFSNPVAAERAVYGLAGPVKGVINCAGVNLLRRFEEITLLQFEQAMRVNAYAFPLVVQSLAQKKLLPTGAPLCNVISNAARIPMTHSLIYNASKAAQEMITRQMARELKQYCIFGVNPNKLEGTGMSLQIEHEVLRLRGWNAEDARKYQLAALPAGRETPVEALAEFIFQLMQPIHHPFLTGCILPYGGPIQ